MVMSESVRGPSRPQKPHSLFATVASPHTAAMVLSAGLDMNRATLLGPANLTSVLASAWEGNRGEDT